MPDSLDYRGGPTEAEQDAREVARSRRMALVTFVLVVAIAMSMLLVGVIYALLTTPRPVPD